MPISFQTIPSNLRVPGTYVEIDGSKALSGLPQLEDSILVIGQKLSGGTAPANIPVLVQDLGTAQALFGRGSHLMELLTSLSKQPRYLPIYALPLDDNGAGVQASGTVAITGPATQSGTLNLYIGGQRVQSVVVSGDSANAVAANLNTAINANGDLLVTSTVSTNTVTITARHKGEIGNDIDLRLNYLGSLGGEATPAGLGITITALSGGASNPVLTTALANLGDEIYTYWVCPYTDTTSLNAIQAELDDRWGSTQKLYGHCFTARRGTLGNLQTFGLTRNDEHMTCLGFNDSPSTASAWAAAMAGQIGLAATADPARPFQTLPLNGVLAPPVQSRFGFTDKQTLLYAGIGTYTTDKDGTVRIDRELTTYRTNPAGGPDATWLDSNTPLLTQKCSRLYLAAWSRAFPRAKLADDGPGTIGDDATVTPGIAREWIIGFYQLLIDAGLCEDLEAFKAALVVERNATDPNRLDVLLPFKYVGQLRITAVKLQFRLN